MLKHAILIGMITLLSASMLMAEEDSASVRRKTKTAAAAYSLVTTLVPEGVSILFLAQGGNHSKARNRACFAFGLTGPVFGPGAGHLYAGNTQKFNNGTLLRGCLAAVGVAALYSSESDAAGVVALSSGAIVAFSMIYDIATVGKSVDRHNQSRGFSNLLVRPQYFAAAKAVGLNVSMSF
jgi:hypothetical protein